MSLTAVAEALPVTLGAIPLPEATTLVFALLTGVTVVAVTLLADHLGGRIGGLLATAPVTTSAAHVVLVMSVSPEAAAGRVLDGGYSLIASTLGAVGFFYGVKFMRGTRTGVRIAAGLVAYLGIFIPGTLLLAGTGLPPTVTFPVLFAGHVALAFTFMRVPVPALDGYVPKTMDRTPRELTARFLAGAVLVILINGLIAVSPALAGALAVMPAVFIVSLTVMGVNQNPPFAARAAQSGLFGITSVTMFVLTVAGVLALQPPGGIWVALPFAWVAYGSTLTFLGKLHGRLVEGRPASA